jgi:hypothetical protein
LFELWNGVRRLKAGVFGPKWYLSFSRKLLETAPVSGRSRPPIHFAKIKPASEDEQGYQPPIDGCMLSQISIKALTKGAIGMANDRKDETANYEARKRGVARDCQDLPVVVLGQPTEKKSCAEQEISRDGLHWTAH